jgi:hypothetical protein
MASLNNNEQFVSQDKKEIASFLDIITNFPPMYMLVQGAGFGVQLYFQFRLLFSLITGTWKIINHITV